ncbi:polysaccharide deacetylase family protein [Ahrensia sp. R2A130]|uniref:polysaccharide deacetylase family protein n=1 Tax=Ahrensia sp. R2A130 TaxID=744979 RepID=UPI001B3B7DAA|nr:polysaccharide deacetylase family protein [Ahrensia sp. R2A130]
MRISLWPALLAPVLTCAVFWSAVPSSAHAASCGAGKLGTHRTMKVSTDKFRDIQGFEKSFGLRRGEVVLTFDDGPIAGKTPRILQALKAHCAKATFFSVGRMAKAYPRLTRRIVREGHTLAHHTHAHNRMTAYGPTRRGQLIDRGIATVERIAYGSAKSTPRVPFFRYPYLARSKATDKTLRQRGLISFGANIDSRDWESVSANTVHDRVMKRLRQSGKGIILLHDIQSRTAKMLPRLLNSLKAEGYKLVHIVPGTGAPKHDIGPEVDEQIVMAAAEAEPTPEKQVAKVDRTKRTVSQSVVAIALAEHDASERERQLAGGVTVAEVPAKQTRATAPQPKSVATKSDPIVTAVLPDDKVSDRVVTTAKLSPKVQSIIANRRKATIVKSTERKKQRASKRSKSSKFARVANAKWKLRRSQWIMN